SSTLITTPPGLTQRARPLEGVNFQAPPLVHFSAVADTKERHQGQPVFDFASTLFVVSSPRRWGWAAAAPLKGHPAAELQPDCRQGIFHTYCAPAWTSPRIRGRRPQPAVKRSDLAGWAEYGYCASHSRFFWGLRLHLVRTLQGLPVALVLTCAKAIEREVLLDMLVAEQHLTRQRPGQILLADVNYYGRAFEYELVATGVRFLRLARKGEAPRAGSHLFKPLRQLIESVNQTLKCQLDLERHGGRTPTGVTVRILQRILALTAAV
ncbi:transposase IS4 family protein, partial [Actinobacteria bacterium OK006]